MTSNVSFLTNLKENFKRRSWATMLLGLFFFIIYVIVPIVMVSQIERPYITDELKYMRESFTSLMGFNYFTGSMMAVFAVLFALHGYSYLFNRRKMDLYLSVPLSTKRRFFVIQLTGILTFIALYIAFAGFALIIGATSSLVTAALFKDLLLGLLLNILLFIAIYELTTIAVMMTGHVIVAFLAFLVFSLYELLIGVLHHAYLSIFMSHLIVDEMPEYVFSSPFYPYFSLQDQLQRSQISVGTDFIVQNILWLLVLCLVFFVIAFALYKIRPNEATDRAISFSKTKPFINIALQILAGLGSGIFFYSISYDSHFMALFGIVLGCLLLFAIMNIIFAFDVRAIFKNWKTLIISIAVCLLYFFIIVGDVFGVDNYIPKEEDIVSCGISNYELNPIGYPDESSYIWRAKESDSACSQMQLTEVGPFLALAESGVNADYNYDGNYRSYTICFHLENGRDVYRNYSISDEAALPELKKIFTSSEYITSMKEKIDENITTQNPDPYFDNGFYDIHLEKDNIEEIITSYKKDLSYYTFEDNVLDTPIAIWKFYEDEHNNQSINLPIYENFSYTMDLLNKYNLKDDLKVNPDEIAKVELYLNPVYSNDMPMRGDSTEDSYVDLSTTLRITDPDEISFLLENSISSRFDSFSYRNINTLQSSGVDYHVDMYVFPKVGTSHEEDLSRAHFRYYGDLPEFIAENYYLEY